MMRLRGDWRRAFAGLAASAALLGADALAAGPQTEPSYLARAPQEEVIYFVLPDRFANGDTRNDRGGLRGGPLQTGFDPTHKGFFHGGDLAGLTSRLDYVAGLGATAIWLGPIYRNKPVQGPPGQESAGYHGYWITDFTDVDPHFGTRAEFRRFVDAAHARGMKVYLDIITNHTADVIQFRECQDGGDCGYRSRADYPYTRMGGPDGREINPDFLGDSASGQNSANFSRLTNPDYAYDVYVPRGETQVKRPAWLNNPIYYHNRGNFGARGESYTHGDFSGLDDLFTEHPRVVQGFIDIYGQWIDDFGIDGFRVDTARHVNPEFWQAFIPAMRERARLRGIENFHIFGEIYDTEIAALARHTRVDGFPSVLDFAFQDAVTAVVARGEGTELLARVFAGDAVYEGGAEAAMQLPTFLGNHDMGRFAHFVSTANPAASDGELLARVTLGHAIMMFARGAPVIYSGDEQGFTGDGRDQDAREDMFPSRVASYNDNRLIGTTATTAQANYDINAPLYRAIAEMAALRAAHPALRRGRQIVRGYSEQPGVFALSRILDGTEALVVFNTSNTPIRAQVDVDPSSRSWRSARGQCAPSASAPESYAVALAPFDYMICLSETAP
jgi:glycosidase